MTSIQIIVGTVMGTALDVAEHAESHLQSRFNTSINTDFSDNDIHNADVILICTSNTGVGDLPSNIIPFYNFLCTKYPAIAEKPYGLINLGDSNYPSFGEAGKKLDEAMLDLGAKRVGEPLILDASQSQDYRALTAAWIDQWITLL